MNNMNNMIYIFSNNKQKKLQQNKQKKDIFLLSIRTTFVGKKHKIIQIYIQQKTKNKKLFIIHHHRQHTKNKQ